MLYDEMTGKGLKFTVIAVALDSGGNDAARPWIEAAKPAYPCLIDKEHRLEGHYGMYNVPTAAWIDEAGRIVRPAEPAGASDTIRARDPKTGQISPEAQAESKRRRDAYYAALRDWVQNGEKSQYVLNQAEVRRRVRLPSPERVQGLAHFRLGLYLNEQGRKEEAKAEFDTAFRIWPQGWTMLRQAWNLDPAPPATPPLDRLGQAMTRPGVTFFREPLEMKGL